MLHIQIRNLSFGADAWRRTQHSRQPSLYTIDFVGINIIICKFVSEIYPMVEKSFYITPGEKMAF